MRAPASLLLVVAISALASAQEPEEAYMLHMYQNKFIPDPLVVAPGTPLVAMNFDPHLHSVRSIPDGRLFFLPEVPPGAQPREFRAPYAAGTYTFYCTFHGTPDGGGMAGVLRTEGEPVGPPPEPERRTPFVGLLLIAAGVASGALLRPRTPPR